MCRKGSVPDCICESTVAPRGYISLREMGHACGASISLGFLSQSQSHSLLNAKHQRNSERKKGPDVNKSSTFLILTDMQETQTQTNANLSIYEQVRTVPEKALKKIEAGRLKGKSDINPMWRIKVLSELFGPVGLGWYTEVTRKWTETSENGETAVFIDINLYVKMDGGWSKPIHGTGGNKLVSLEKKWENGEQIITQYLDDDAYKKAYTDAISVACKALGIGADVYWEADSTKYTGNQAAYNQPQDESGQDNRQELSPKSPYWNQAVAFTATLRDSNEEIRKRVQSKYIITKDNCDVLLRQAGKLA